MWSTYIDRLVSGLDLEAHEISSVMETILLGKAEISEIKSFLVALKNKGETVEEVSALVNQMFAHSAPISITERAVDTVGTGGDGAHTINISTTAAIIAASAGARVVKHGNRAASSKSGSGDLLEALGVAITLDGKAVERTVKELGIGFCFAHDRMHLVMAQVLATRGVDGFVFRGDDGLDEITLSSTTSVLSIGDGEIRSDVIEPSDFGITRAPVSDLVGGDAVENARITLAIFAGEKGAPRDAVLLNAAAAIAAFEGEQDLSVHERIARGLKKAEKAVDNGATTALLEKWIALTQSLVVPS